jgi:hypothetical protein
MLLSFCFKYTLNVMGTTHEKLMLFSCVCIEIGV